MKRLKKGRPPGDGTRGKPFPKRFVKKRKALRWSRRHVAELLSREVGLRISESNLADWELHRNTAPKEALDGLQRIYYPDS